MYIPPSKRQQKSEIKQTHQTFHLRGSNGLTAYLFCDSHLFHLMRLLCYAENGGSLFAEEAGDLVSVSFVF